MVRGIALIAMLACGCASAAPAPSDHMVAPGVAPQRPLCGWDEISPASEVTHLATADTPQTVAPGQSLATLVIEPNVPFATVRRALAPARNDLVRIKVAFDGRWLLPLTHPAHQPPKPPPGRRVESIVGHHRITRSKTAPRARLADLRIAGETLRLFVENEHPAGTSIAVSKLKAVLRATEPPIDTFMLSATDDTPWRVLASVIRAAACYDRAAGEEPHEIVLDPASPR